MTGVDTSSWLTCAAASDLIGVSENTIRSWARLNRLTSLRDRRPHPSGAVREVEVYNPSELAAILAKRGGRKSVSGPGEIAACAFELFDRGAPLREVVTHLRETPERVAELHEQWLDLGGADLVIGAEARQALVRLVGPFDGVAGLVERVAEALTCRIEVAVEEGSRIDGASDAAIETAINTLLDAAEGVSP